jgi:hypothetical protein
MTARLEQQFQIALVEHLRWRAPRDMWWCHYPSGGRRNAVEAAILKSMGTKPGVPDLLLVKDGKFFALELKVLGGRLSRAQVECHEDLRRAGAMVDVATGIDESLKILTEWGALPGGGR